jgi:protein PhnA
MPLIDSAPLCLESVPKKNSGYVLLFTNLTTANKFYVMEVKDSNGNVLNDGNSVTLIKDLKVKGSSLTLKRGTVVKKIKLTDDAQEVDCRVNGSSIVLRTEFLKKT